ncbi:MAG: DUF455 family protein [Sandaracinaceae bacterium]|nr:DUF455 family protein [Sandaracinaceae bacterium]
MPPGVVREATAEAWARDYVRSRDLGHKLAPPPRPRTLDGVGLAIEAPGRPPELEPAARAPKTPRPGALSDPRKRAQLLHTFLHHELQAAELMCWAVLAFPDAPEAFRRGLLSICDDEIRHMGLYVERLRALGHAVGDFPVRDWFWERVPRASTPLAFVSLLGIGFEGANLDHAARFAEALRGAGDEASAAVQEQVGREEEAHVRFAVRWYEEWAGPLELTGWLAALPPPLTPIVMRGRPLAHAARRRAGQPAGFVDALEAYAP